MNRYALRLFSMCGFLLILACDGEAEPEAADPPMPANGVADVPARASAAAASNWQMRADGNGHAAHEEVRMDEVDGALRVTTGPAVIIYDADSSASGDYRVQATFELFDPGQRREGYGLILGGQQLEGEAQRYTYFLLRRDGRFLIKTRDGADTRVVREWSESPAIVGWEGRQSGAETARNTMTVALEGQQARFLVNDTEVASVPRTQLGSTDGVFGLRINHALDVRVTGLSAAGS